MKSKNKDSAVKDITRYSSSKIYIQLLGVFNAFIKPKLLSPELFGLLNILNLIPRYASYAHLGSRDSLRYKIPYNEAKNEFQKNSELKGSVFYGSLYINLFIAFLLIIFSLKGNFSLEVRLGILAMAFLVLATWYYEYYISLLKSYQIFKLIASSNYLKATVTCFLGVILIYFFSIYGAYLISIISLIVVIFYFLVKHPLGFHIKFRFKVFEDLVRQGLPIMLFNISSELMRTSDRIIVSYFLGIEQLGYYGIAAMIISSLIQIPGAARDVIEPRLMQDLDNNSEEKILNEYFFKPLFNTAYLLPFLIGPVFFLLPLIIPLVLPRYVPGILPAQINVIGCYFLLMSYPARGIIVANNWQLKASTILVLTLFVNITLNIFFLKLEMGLKGVAIGSSVSFLILFISLLLFIGKRSTNTYKDWTTNIKGLCLPFPVMCASILLVENLSKIVQVNYYLIVFIKIAIFFTIMLTTHNIAFKKYPLIKEIKLRWFINKKD